MDKIRSALYRLSHKYGVTVEYYEEGDLVIDPKAGTATSNDSKTVIKQCIRLPAVFMRNHLGSFTFDTQTEKLYVSRRNIRGNTPRKQGYLNIVSSRYEILEVHNFNGDLILEIKEYEGVEPRVQVDSKITTQIGIMSNVT